MIWDEEPVDRDVQVTLTVDITVTVEAAWRADAIEQAKRLVMQILHNDAVDDYDFHPENWVSANVYDPNWED